MKLSQIFFTLILAVLTTFSNKISCQPTFHHDTTYLPGVSIKKIRSVYNGELWVQTTSTPTNIYRIDRNGITTNKTGYFSEEILNNMTDFDCIDTNEILISTTNNYLYHFKNDSIIHINTIKHKSISALYVKKEKEYLNGRNTTNTLFTGYISNDSIFFSNTITDDYRYHGKGKKFLCKDNPYITYTIIGSDYYVYCKDRRGHFGMGEYDTTKYHEILTANAYFYSSGAPDKHFIGTDIGYIEEDWGRKLYSQNVSSILHLAKFEFIIGADSGLYYHSSKNKALKLNIPAENTKIYDIEFINGNIYAASDIGVLKVNETNCDKFNVKLLQDRQYIKANNKELITFFHNSNYGAKQFYWDFGDGFNSQMQFPIHSYNNPGNYQVQLITSNGFCYDTSASIITSYDKNSIDSTSYIEINKAPFGDVGAKNGSFNIIDVDNDWKAELFIPTVGLYQINEKDTIAFDSLPVDPFPNGVVSIWGDINNDGLNDLITGSLIYKNLGNNKFEKIQTPGTSHSYASKICLFDLNNDGMLDIASGSYSGISIIINKGDFEFELLPDITNNCEYVTGIKWFDIDNDNDNDLLVCQNSSYYHNSNEYERTQLFLNNNGNLTETEYDLLTSNTHNAVNLGDLNNDKQLDIYIDEIERSFDTKNLLLMSNGSDSLIKINNTWLTSESKGKSYAADYDIKSSVFADFDNNGYLDCIKLSDDNEHRAFMNYGNMIFVNDNSNPINQINEFSPKSVGASDLNGDGKIDLLVGHDKIFDSKNHLFLNTSNNTNNWVKLNCSGTKSNSNAIGSKVYLNSVLNSKSHWQMRYIESNAGENSQNGYQQHFGLGDATSIDTLKILWPSGINTVLTNLPVNKIINIVEPSIKYFGDTILCENEPLIFSMPGHNDITYKWMLNDTLLYSDTLKFPVKMPGAYKCIITSPFYSVETPIINITINPVYKSEIIFKDEDPLICFGDSAQILYSTYANSRYLWYFDNSFKFETDSVDIYINDSISIQQVLINNFGCSDTSNTIHSNYLPELVIMEDEFVGSCFGDTLTIKVDSTYDNYLWSNGDTSYVTSFKGDSVLSLKVTHHKKCKATDTVRYIPWQIPTFDLGKDTSLYSGESIYLSTGLDAYSNEFLWDNGSTNSFRFIYSSELTEGENMIYTHVTSEFGCNYSDTLTIDYKPYAPLDSLSDFYPVIFPNPNSGSFKILLAEKHLPGSLKVYKTTGVLVYSCELNSIYNKISIPNLKKGVYFAEFNLSGHETERFKFIIN